MAKLLTHELGGVHQLPTDIDLQVLPGALDLANLHLANEAEHRRQEELTERALREIMLQPQTALRLIEEPAHQAMVSMQAIVDQISRIAVDWNASERWLAGFAPYAEELGRRGWTFPIQWCGTRFVEVVKQVPEEELDDGFVSYYTSDDGAAFEELVTYLAAESLLDRWRPLLNGAVDNYRRGYHEAAVTNFLVVFSGLHALATEGLTRNAEERATAAKFRKAEKQAVRLLCWASLHGFTAVFFRPLRFDEPPPSRLNRHWNQHGRMLAPSPQADCLRLLQAIETLTLLAR
jgi:hypothetical protein